MTKNRVKVPHKTEVRILLKNKHTCCLCRDFKNYQEPIIHHIDGDPSNNNEDNLAVLCLNHSSMADAGLKKGKLGSGKKLKPDEVKLFKKIWENKVIAESNVERMTMPTRERKQLEILYKFEISKRKNEILSLSSRQKEKIKENYEFLQELVFEEWTTGMKLRPIILKAFNDIALMSLNQNFIQLPLLEAISGLFIHLAGPKYVKLDSEDRNLLLKSLDVFETVGEFEAELSDDTILLKRTCKKIYQLSEVASWYSFRDFLDRARFTLNKIKKECFKYEADKKRKNNKILIKAKIRIVDGAIDLIEKLR